MTNTFTWIGLTEALYFGKILLRGWPFAVRLPGDPAFSEADFSGLEGQEVVQLLKMLHEKRYKLVAWDAGKCLTFDVYVVYE